MVVKTSVSTEAMFAISFEKLHAMKLPGLYRRNAIRSSKGMMHLHVTDSKCFLFQCYVECLMREFGIVSTRVDSIELVHNNFNIS
jgi:hypothetical protein